MELQTIKELINEPLTPNPTEWAKNVESVLEEHMTYSEECKNAVESVIFYNGREIQYRDLLVYALKKLLPDEDIED